MEVRPRPDLTRILAQPLLHQRQDRAPTAHLRESLHVPDEAATNPFLVARKDHGSADPASRLETVRRLSRRVREGLVQLQERTEGLRSLHRGIDRGRAQGLLEEPEQG